MPKKKIQRGKITESVFIQVKPEGSQICMDALIPSANIC